MTKKVELTNEELLALQFVLKDCTFCYCSILEKKFGYDRGLALYKAYNKIDDAVEDINAKEVE